MQLYGEWRKETIARVRRETGSEPRIPAASTINERWGGWLVALDAARNDQFGKEEFHGT